MLPAHLLASNSGSVLVMYTPVSPLGISSTSRMPSFSSDCQLMPSSQKPVQQQAASADKGVKPGLVDKKPNAYKMLVGLPCRLPAVKLDHHIAQETFAGTDKPCHSPVYLPPWRSRSSRKWLMTGTGMM
jgi:hypothetical protein